MTREQKFALYRRLKDERPAIAAFIDEVIRVWPGAKVTYVEIGEEKFGERTGVDIPAQPGPLWRPAKPAKRRTR